MRRARGKGSGEGGGNPRARDLPPDELTRRVRAERRRRGERPSRRGERVGQSYTVRNEEAARQHAEDIRAVLARRGLELLPDGSVRRIIQVPTEEDPG